MPGASALHLCDCSFFLKGLKLLGGRTLRWGFSELQKGNVPGFLQACLHGLRVSLRTILKWRINAPARKLPAGQSPVSRARRYRVEAEKRFNDWQLPSALASVNRSIGLFEGDAAAHRLNCELLEMLGDRDGAKTSALEAFRREPFTAKSITLLAKYHDADVVSRALDHIWDHVERRNWSRGVVINAAKTWSEFGRQDAAIELLTEAEERGVFLDKNELVYVTAITRLRRREFAEASKLFISLTEHPSYGRASRIYAGECFYELGEFDRAVDFISSAYSLDEPSRIRGFSDPMYQMRFKAGKCREGFMESRARPLTHGMQEDTQGNYVQQLVPLANARSALVVADYGIGDEIRFASIYPDLIDVANQLLFTCEPRLERIFRRSFPGAKFIPTTRWRGELVVRDPETRAGVRSRRLTPVFSKIALDAAERAGAFTSIFDMLAELRPDHHSFERGGQYLRADPRLVDKWKERISRQTGTRSPNVAISWRSLLKSSRRLVHYLDAQDLAPLASVNATFWLFQTSIEEEELSALRSILPAVRVINGLDLRDDFEGMAAFLANMDCVVAPLNTTAEFAGALGVPTIIFGRTEGSRCRVTPDGVDRWHPSARWAFGTPLGERAATVDAIANELRHMLKQNELVDLAAE